MCVWKGRCVREIMGIERTKTETDRRKRFSEIIFYSFMFCGWWICVCEHKRERGKEERNEIEKSEKKKKPTPSFGKSYGKCCEFDESFKIG